MIIRGVTTFVLGRDLRGVTPLAGSPYNKDGVNLKKGFRESDLTKYATYQSRLFMKSCRTSNQCWRGASRRPNGQGVNCTPGVRRGAGQPVVQADLRRLQSDASVRLISCSAA